MRGSLNGESIHREGVVDRNKVHQVTGHVGSTPALRSKFFED